MARRHGIPIGALALVLSWFGAARLELAAALFPLSAAPMTFAVAFFLAFLSLRGQAERQTWTSLGGPTRLAYFFAVAVCEEWIFRVALPSLAVPQIGWLPTVLGCSLAFGGLHALTLGHPFRLWARAAYGGFLLALLYGVTRDFALIVLLHWLAQVGYNASAPVRRSRRRPHGLRPRRSAPRDSRAPG